MTTSNIANAKAPKQALAGVRVLDFSWAASGPLSTLYLSLLGAEVIKVESARSLDIARRGYYTVVDDINASPNFNDMHMGKLSIRLDLRHPKAKELVLRLVALCDAAVENFRPGTLDKFGLGYEALRQARPDLIMVSSSTAGQTGPERAMPGYATTFGALGGLGGVTGYRGGPATELWDSIDMRLGTSITLAALIGLYDRRRTGRGQYVDFSSREVISATIGDSLLGYFMTGEVPGPKGNEDEVMAPHDCYPCRGDDRWVSIAVSTEDEWRALCAVSGEGWDADPRFTDMAARRRNRTDLDARIAAWTRGHVAADLAERLRGAGVPAAESQDAASLFDDPHLAARGAFLEVEHPKIGVTHPVRPPFVLSETPVGPARYGPMFGEHIEYVFGELAGLSAGELAALGDEGVFN